MRNATQYIEPRQPEIHKNTLKSTLPYRCVETLDTKTQHHIHKQSTAVLKHRPVLLFGGLEKRTSMAGLGYVTSTLNSFVITGSTRGRRAKAEPKVESLSRRIVR